MDLIEPINGDPARARVMGPIFMLVLAILVLLVIIGTIRTLIATTSTPSASTGWNGMNYAGGVASRIPMVNIPGFNTATQMTNFTVATAAFGGIFTEPTSSYFGVNVNPWLGNVSTEAAKLQVDAGARAIVFDIWPNPSDPTQPVVCAMADTTAWGIQNWWVNTGKLNAGMTGTYSNWQLLTRNVVNAMEMLQAAVEEAFAGNNPQKADPFFLILRLHGAMNTDYLNTVGAAVQNAVGGYAMGPEYVNMTYNQYCQTPFSEFISSDSQSGKVFVMVSPELTTPLVSKFLTAYNASTLKQNTNLLDMNPQQLTFNPGTANMIPKTMVASCATNGQQIQLNEASYTLVMPSTGGKSTVNDDLYAIADYQSCLQTGAQFVGLNLFSPSSSDGPLNTFFQDDLFGKQSFVLSANLK
jgi:hypothetical protein